MKQDHISILFPDDFYRWCNEQFYSVINTREISRYPLEELKKLNIKEKGITEISQQDIQYILEHIAVGPDGKQKISYVEKIYTLLNQYFKGMVWNGKIKTHPMKNMIYRRKCNKNMMLLTQNQIRCLFDQIPRGEWCIEILLILHYKLSKNIIYGLKFSDFDIEKKSLYISRKVNFRYVEISNGKKSLKPQEEALQECDQVLIEGLDDSIISELKMRRLLIDRDIRAAGKRYHHKDLICCNRYGDYRSSSALDKYLQGLGREIGYSGRLSISLLRNQSCG